MTLLLACSDNSGSTCQGKPTMPQADQIPRNTVQSSTTQPLTSLTLPSKPLDWLCIYCSSMLRACQPASKCDIIKSLTKWLGGWCCSCMADLTTADDVFNRRRKDNANAYSMCCAGMATSRGLGSNSTCGWINRARIISVHAMRLISWRAKKVVIYILADVATVYRKKEKRMCSLLKQQSQSTKVITTRCCCHII